MFNKLLKNLLLRVNLNGLIDECALVVKKGKGMVSVVDDSNSVLVICSAKIGEKDEDSELGLTSLGTLCKFISDSTDDLLYAIDKKNWLTLKRGKRGGNLKMLLNEADTMPNTIEDGASNKKALLKASHVTFKLTDATWGKLAYYIGLLSGASSGSMFIAVKKGRVTAYSSPHEKQQFEIPLGKASSDSEDGASEIYAKYLEAVIKSVDWDLDVMVSFGNELPVIIHQEGDGFESFWAITPLL